MDPVVTCANAGMTIRKSKRINRSFYGGTGILACLVSPPYHSRFVMPSHSPDAIVIGAGIIGSSIAWKLAAAGLRVTLLDARQMGGEASWAGAGMLAPGGEVKVRD